MLFGSCSTSYRPHKSGGGLTWRDLSPQVGATSKYPAVRPELPGASTAFPLTGDGDEAAAEVGGAELCQSPGQRGEGRQWATRGGRGAELADPRSTLRALRPCKSPTNPGADRDVFLAVAAQLSLLVSLRRRRRLLVYLQMLEVIL